MKENLTVAVASHAPSLRVLADTETPPRMPRTASRLTEEEARFVWAAASLILAGSPGHDRIGPDVVAFVERLLAGEQGGFDTSTERAAELLATYRLGISAIQVHCAAEYGMAFDELPSSCMYQVLSLLEDGDRAAGFERHTHLIPLLLRHAAEAYFEAVQPSPCSH
jgi:hypothetical protein